MEHILDNMIWNAMTTGNKHLAMVNENIGVYHADIAPFASMKKLTKENLEALYNFIPAERSVDISYLDEIPLDENKWKMVQQMNVSQMVYTHPVKTFTTQQSSLIVPLTEKDIPQMLELTALTRPGPFLQNTIQFGNYFGIFAGEKLAAMTGQRMHPTPYMEISAVCTHPHFRGKGYAKVLMLHVMEIVVNNSFIPFLHVLSDNAGAIKLYESIGFSLRRKLHISIIKKI